MRDMSARRPAYVRSRRLWAAGGLLVLAASVLLRVPGLSTDLWLDELWSLENSLGALGWQELFLQTRIDNNHHLNSLYLYLIGPQSNPIAYRLLAFVSGVATVATAWIVGARDSRLAATIAALLFGTSYIMVFYATEARGYATVVWLTLAAWYFLMRYADAPRKRWAAGFAVCSVLGMMAHPTFVMFFIGAYVWFDAHQSKRSRLRAATTAVGRLFVLPTALIGAYYVIALRGQEIGGGPPYSPVTVGAQTLAAVSGGPLTGDGLWITAAIVATAFVLSVRSARRLKDDRWLLYLVAGFVIPLIITAARQPPTLSPRYFIVPASVLLLAASVWISRTLAQAGVAARAAVATLLLAHVIGGVLHATSGAASRGHYRLALERMVGESTGDAVIIASSDRYSGHDARTRVIVGYHRQSFAAGHRVRYVTAEEYPPTGADWVIVESLGEPPPPSVTDPAGHQFALKDVYPAGDLSGTTWYVYRRA